tara:strand:- start:315 stop:1574 length:1260 start_codon:yes stop_codon:yes gene_type:complete
MIINKRLRIYVVLIFSLLIGYFFGENSSGGAKIDFGILYPYIENLRIDFKEGFYLYVNRPGILIHSPFFNSIISILLKIHNDLTIIKICYLLVCSILPFIFYLIIQTKFKLTNNYVFYISLVIFLSPYFRSSSIWLLGDNLAIIFFSLSTLFFIKSFNEKSNFKNYFLCLFFLILCSYVRYYYCVYALFFLFYFYQDLNKKNFIFLLIFSFLLSLPALVYFYYIIENHNFLSVIFKYGKLNIYSNILIILSIFLFYLIPIVIFDWKLILSYFKKNFFFFFLVLLSIMTIYLLDRFTYFEIITFSSRGGGVFIKFFELLNFEVKLFMSLISFSSIIILDYLFQKERFRNYFLLTVIVFSIPLYALFQKYLDPLIFIIIFGLFKSRILSDMLIKQNINIKFFIFYFFSFYIFSIFYYANVF